MADAAFELVRRGYRVLVITSDRGYDDPSLRYPRRETIGGVEIRRVPFSSFGKRGLGVRALAASIYMAQALLASLFTRRLRAVVYHTSPPFVGSVANIISRLRGCPTIYWVMDLNPDQLIALGRIGERSLTARLLSWFNDAALQRASLIIALDRFMKERIGRRGALQQKTVVIPPWPHDEQMQLVDRDTNPFRQRQGWGKKKVVMYSGNHSPSNPLTTLLDAAVHFKNDSDLVFAFIGGGSGKKEVEAYIEKHQLTNVVSLPYQPMSELQYSLSAADVHVVSLGDRMVGVIHPCKVYGALAVRRPILYFGPEESHIGDMLEGESVGWRVAHGDVKGAVAAIERIRALPQADLDRMGTAASDLVETRYTQSELCNELCDEIEKCLGVVLTGEAASNLARPKSSAPTERVAVAGAAPAPTEQRA